jgi:hypothetical protein
MRQAVYTKRAKTSKSRIIMRSKFVGLYARLRIPRAAMRHNEDDLSKLFRTQRYLPPIVFGDKGEVRIGFGGAPLANKSILGQYVATVKYSEVPKWFIRGYVKWLKKVARREKWPKRMLAVELQGLLTTG